MTLGKLFDLSFTLVSTSVLCNDINSTYIIDLLNKEIICEEMNDAGSWQPGCDVPSGTEDKVREDKQCSQDRG